MNNNLANVITPGDIFRMIRIAKNLKTSDVAERLNTTATYVSGVERSGRLHLSEVAHHKFCKALGVKMAFMDDRCERFRAVKHKVKESINSEKRLIKNNCLICTVWAY